MEECHKVKGTMRTLSMAFFRMNAKAHHTKSKVKEGYKLANGVRDNSV